MTTHNYKNVQGIVWMLVNSLATVILYALGKHATDTIHPLQVVFLYKLVVLIGVLCYVAYVGIECIKTKKLPLHMARGFFSSLGGILFFYGLHKVDIGNAIALSKLEPIFLMMISIIYFNEKLTQAKFLSFIISFIGMIFVIYPVVEYSNGELIVPWLSNAVNMPAFNPNYLIILLAMLSWSVNSSLVKMLGKTESNRTQLFYVSLISVILTFPLALYLYEENAATTLTLPLFLTFVLLGLLYFIHAVCHFMSLKVAEMSVVIPYDYSKLVFGAVVSYCFFTAEPSFSSYIGYGLIIAAGIYLFKKNVRAKKNIVIDNDDM